MSNISIFNSDHYLQLLNLVYEVAQSLKGKVTTDQRQPDCEQLAAKLFFHATTIYSLSEGTKAPVPYSEKGAFFYDFASIAVLTRAVLETYLTMFEVFFEPKSDDDFEFNHALWQLSGFIIRENHVPSDPAFIALAIFAQKDIQALRDRIAKTNKFKKLSSGEQKDVLKGKRKRNWKMIAKAAGFKEETIRHLYAYYSGYTHADGLSGVQIVAAQTKDEQVQYIQMYMCTVMIVLSKMIIEYAKAFPESKKACDRNLKTYWMAQLWSRIVA